MPLYMLVAMLLITALSVGYLYLLAGRTARVEALVHQRTAALSEAAEALRANEYIKGMRGEWQTQAQYEAQQESCDEGVCANIDQDMCSYVFIPDFDVMLGALEVDVLAIFGEKDLNVDWRKTRDFYQATLADNPEANLAIETFAGADHNLNLAETGSIREMQAMTAPVKADGYYQVQIDWLREHVLEREP